MSPTICIETGVRYEIRIFFGKRRFDFPEKLSQVLIDSLILVPPTDSVSFFHGSEEAEYRKQVYDR